MIPLIKIILDTRRKKSNELYPVKLRVTYNRKQRYYPINIDMSKADFNEIYVKNPPTRIKKTINLIKKEEGKALEIIDELKTFSFKKFDALYKGAYERSASLKFLYDEYIKKLRKNDQIRTAESYKYSFGSLSSFFNKEIQIEDVDVDFLNEYEKWMLNKGRSANTIGIYLRPLRSIFNIAVESQIIYKEEYPFGKGKYIIPSTHNVKRALSINDIKKIFFYKSENTAENSSKDYWMFSYLCHGLNFKDIARLKYKNLKDNCLEVIRSKTINSTKSSQHKIVIPLLPESKAIINRLSQKRVNNETYIFPILDSILNEEEKIKKLDLFISTTNKYMGRIGNKLGVKLKLTTYVARHSYATIMYQNGTPLTMISEQLGHHNIQTTENYLGSFTTDQIKDYSKVLIDFSNEKN